MDFEAPNYNALKKKPKKKNLLPIYKDEEEDNCSDVKLLNLFETRIIPTNILESFKRHGSEQWWSGELSKEALFDC